MIALLVFIKLYLFIYVLHYYTDDGGGALHYTRLQHTHGDRNKEMKERRIPWQKGPEGEMCVQFSREFLFDDTINTFMRFQSRDFLKDLKVSFGEGAMDVGGVSRRTKEQIVEDVRRARADADTLTSSDSMLVSASA